MKAASPVVRIEFYHHEPYNLIMVESGENGVVVRAAFNNFSDQRKSFFIRELAVEGFIPDRYQWLTDTDASGYSGVRWVIDRSWLAETPAAVRRKATPYVVGMFVAAGLLLFLTLGRVLSTSR